MQHSAEADQEGEEQRGRHENKQDMSLTEDDQAIITELNVNASVNSRFSGTQGAQFGSYFNAKDIEQQLAAMSVVTSSNEDAIRMPSYITHISNVGKSTLSPPHLSRNYQGNRKLSPTFNPSSFTRQFINQQRAYKNLIMQAASAAALGGVGGLHNQRQFQIY